MVRDMVTNRATNLFSLVNLSGWSKYHKRTERDESQIDFSYTGDIKSKKSDSSKGQDTHMGCYSLTAKEFDQEKFQCLSF